MNLKYNMQILKQILVLVFLISMSWSTHAQQDVRKPEMPFEVEYSVKGGFYTEEIIVELSAPGAKIYYTLDGSTPGRKLK